MNRISKNVIFIVLLLTLTQLFKNCNKSYKTSARISTTVKSCDIAPIIDAKMESEWLNYTPVHLKNFNVGEMYVKDSLDLSSNFRMTWDKNYIYMYIIVFDDIKFNLKKIKYKIDIPEYYNCDCVELFFAADINKKSGTGTFKTSDADSRFAFIYNSNKIIEITEENHEIAWAKSDTKFGYNFEIKIPFETLSIDPIENQIFGFEISIDDNDQEPDLLYYNFDNRSVLSWSQKPGSGANAWQNTGVFGNVKLIK